jgi:hypothetical protein
LGGVGACSEGQRPCCACAGLHGGGISRLVGGGEAKLRAHCNARGGVNAPNRRRGWAL